MPGKIGAIYQQCRVYRFENELPERWIVVPEKGSLAAQVLPPPPRPFFPTYEAACDAIDAALSSR